MLGKVGSFLLVLTLAVNAMGQTRGRGSSSVHTQALSYFPYWIDGSSPQSHDQVMQDLLSLESPEQNWPPFPRTWLELGLERSESTTTGWVGRVQAFQGPIPIISNSLRIGGTAEQHTQYRYGVNTTFIAITSLRPLAPNAQENSEERFSNIPTGGPSQALRNIVRWDDYERRTYFNESEQFPIMGLCKFEMTMRIARTNRNTLEFLVFQGAQDDEEVQTVTLAFYSNFFQVESDVPVQEYLRSTCDERFKDLVRYVAETEFNNVVREINAHYHPAAQCTLPPTGQNLNPRGDESCMDWHNDSRYVMGSYRRNTVPRCVLGAEGIPRCVLRSKENVSCPTYLENNRLSTTPTNSNARLMTPGDYQHYPCDVGLQCRPTQGGQLRDVNIGLLQRLSGVATQCRRQ